MSAHNNCPQASELAHAAPITPPVAVGTGGTIGVGMEGTDEVAVGLAGAVVGATVRVGTVAAVVVVLVVVWVPGLEVGWADDVGSAVVLVPVPVVGLSVVVSF